MQKATELLGDCAAWLQVELPGVFEADDPVLGVSPKIARGENYKGLPYLMLDYPRIFNKDNIFAIRTMFWWGNFISCTLHLRGKYVQHYIEPIIRHADKLRDAGFQVCIGEDEWKHEFDPSNYIPISKLPQEALHDILVQKDFIKIAVQIPLYEWNQVKQIITGYYRLLLSVADISYPGDGTSL